MVPRTYSMHRRSESVAETRNRMLDVAVDLFAGGGPTAVTKAEVARRADVSASTVGNHFEHIEELLAAVIQRIVEEIDVPDISALDGADSLPDRIRALTATLFAFYDRSQRWYNVLAAGDLSIPALATANTTVRNATSALVRLALDEAPDPQLLKLAGAMLHPLVLLAFKDAEIPLHGAIELVSESLIHRATAASPPALTRPSPTGGNGSG